MCEMKSIYTKHKMIIPLAQILKESLLRVHAVHMYDESLMMLKIRYAQFSCEWALQWE